jgi:hypothetical protein
VVPAVEPSDVELIQELDRHLGLADALLAGLADDMAAVGAKTASERTERARAALQAARDTARRIGETPTAR